MHLAIILSEAELHVEHTANKIIFFRKYEAEFLFLSQVEEREVIQKTGCLPPCFYSEFTLIEKVEGFYNDYGMALAYATTEVKIVKID